MLSYLITMNRYFALLLASCLLDLGNAGLTEKQKLELVEYHNDARNRVSPPASNMKKLEWDEGLAQIAQGWANRCVRGHNKGRSDKRWWWVGENIAYSSRGDLKRLVGYWEGEKQVYNYATNVCSPIRSNPLLGGCYHYTQMAWAATEYVGCGYKTDCPAPARTRLVCNYGPGGNVNRARPYKRGRKCSACMQGYKRCSKNVCVRG